MSISHLILHSPSAKKENAGRGGSRSYENWCRHFGYVDFGQSGPVPDAFHLVSNLLPLSLKSR
jgi:hypothetical protein